MAAGIQKFYKGFVTHVTDPSSFWMQMGTDSDFDLFRVYQASIDDFFNTNGHAFVIPASDLSLGDCVVVAKRSRREPQQWRRARVSRVEEESVDVFYVDYGYTEIVRIADVRTITPPFFEYMASQAIHVGLAGIQPLTRSWTSRAVAVFKESVLHKSVIVSLLEVDESQFVSVALYTRGEDGNWHSVTHVMLADDLGLPSVYSISFEECISHDVMSEALVLTNQQETAESVEDSQESHEDKELHSNDVEPNEPQANQASNDVLEEQAPKNFQSSRDVQGTQASKDLYPCNDLEENEAFEEIWDDSIERLEESSSEDDILETPINETRPQMMASSVTKPVEADDSADEFFEPEKHAKPSYYMAERGFAEFSQSNAAGVGVSQFNIKPLSQTRSVSANEMQVKAKERTQKKRLNDLKKDLHRCEEEFDDRLLSNTTVHWGRSDSQVGEPHQAHDSDLQESISEELSSRCLSNMDEKAALQQALRVKCVELKKNVSRSLDKRAIVTEKHPESSTSQPKLRHPMTEEESYTLETKIAEVLVNKRQETPEMLRVQVHDIVAPDKALPRDLLAAATTSILESIVCQKCEDPAVALTILETYTVTDAFQDVLIETLKSLKDRFVKLCQSIRISSSHEAYASLLAMLFIQSQCWPNNIGKAVQAFSLSTVERWTIFNIKRLQEQDSVTDTELMYLDCVAIFIRQTSDILKTQFPEHIHSWTNEIREKLLHDLTKRCLRVRLLDMLLENCENVVGCRQLSLGSNSVATQTESSSGRTPHNFGKTNDVALYKAPKGTVYQQDDPYTPHVFPSDSDIEPKVLRSLCTKDIPSAKLLRSLCTKDIPSASGGIEPELLRSLCTKDIPSASGGIEPDVKSPVKYLSDFSLEHPSNSKDCEAEEGQSWPSGCHISSVIGLEQSTDHPDGEDDHLNQVHQPDEMSKSDNSKEEYEKDEDNTEENDPILQKDLKTEEVRIKYSSEALKAMNPLRELSWAEITLTEPYELSHIFHRVEHNSGCAEKSSSPSQIPTQRYNGAGSPLEVSSLAGSNTDKLSKLSNFLSDSIKFHGSNVDTGPRENQHATDHNKNALTSDFVKEKDVDRSESYHIPEAKTEDQGSNSMENWADGVSPLSCKQREDGAGKSEWPENFFRNTVLNAGKKKKKTKFRPLEEFLEGPKTYGVDESESGKDDEFEELNEFSPEALQMYIDLERNESERRQEEGRMIHGSRLTTSSSSKARPSLFADVRKAKSAPAQPWVPQRRKCTRCGSERHTVYDCQEGTINNADDMSYMF
ncbi:tudor domain containing 6-like protein [Plakobranchus ocellatus]|uniref:Tudor domain containing 6-like protein n=1 Tax=Plakobranchus ocellatus TaxID=259542 RepID=A0AAV4BLB8_9GAST|nr:tudor domain containing 6-like protein [Plakobranchus ocellatus]